MNDQATALTITPIDGEPRILDTDLAEKLGMAMPRFIRNDIIEPNREELEGFGSLRATPSNPGPRGGRPGTAYYLNEEQALLICTLSRTPVAKKVRAKLIQVFTAWRRGTLEPKKPSGAFTLPDFTNPAIAARACMARDRSGFDSPSL